MSKFKSALAGAVAMIALAASASTPARAELTAFSTGVVPVALDGERNLCFFALMGGRLNLALAEAPGGLMSINVLPEGFRFTSNGKVTFAIRSQGGWVLSMQASDKGVLSSLGRWNTDEQPDFRDLMHALWNGSQLIVDAGDGAVGAFSLTGSATAIADLHRCAASLRSGSVPTTTAATTRNNEIALMQSRGGGYDINASINGSAPIRFEVDTGASNVVIPRDLAERLGREGRLTQGDFLGNGRATLADGSKIATEHFNLRTLQIGSIVLHNVECTVGNVGSSLLLGMSVFSKFPSWSIDNRRGVLVVGG